MGNPWDWCICSMRIGKQFVVESRGDGKSALYEEVSKNLRYYSLTYVLFSSLSCARLWIWWSADSILGVQIVLFLAFPPMWMKTLTDSERTFYGSHTHLNKWVVFAYFYKHQRNISLLDENIDQCYTFLWFDHFKIKQEHYTPAPPTLLLPNPLPAPVQLPWAQQQKLKEACVRLSCYALNINIV